jgi:hypothetical protein
MLANPAPDVRVILVCNETPEGLPNDPRLIVSSIKTPAPTTPFEQMTDKAIKFRAGLLLAREFCPSWIMRADADDLVSSKVVSFAQGLKPSFGQLWFSELGWRHSLGSRFLFRQNDFHKICGTSHFAYMTPEELPDCYLLHESHSTIVEKQIEALADVNAIPFATTIYVVNSGENHSGPWRMGVGARATLRELLRAWPVTDRLRREFNLLERQPRAPV